MRLAKMEHGLENRTLTMRFEDVATEEVHRIDITGADAACDVRLDTTGYCYGCKESKSLVGYDRKTSRCAECQATEAAEAEAEAI